MNTHKTSLVLLIGFLYVVQAFSQNEPTVANEVYDRTVPADIQYSVRQVEGETVDLRNLSVSWETVDLVVPGEGGLDLVVSRSHRKVSNSPMHLADWHLGIPRIQIPISPFRGVGYDFPWQGSLHDPAIYPQIQEYQIARANIAGILGYLEATGSGTKTNVCNRPGHLQADVDLASSPLAVSGGVYTNGPITLSIPLQGTRSLFHPNGSEIGVRYPAGTAYITNDNWRVECIDRDDAYGQSFFGGFKVFAPNGLIYTIDRLAYVLPGDYIRGSAGGTIELQASKVEDAHGNSLTYEYEELGCTPVQPGCTKLLKKISASDGREVFFDYAPGSADLESIADEQFAFLTGVRYVSDAALGTQEEITYSYCTTYDWLHQNKTCNSNILLDDSSTAVIESRVANNGNGHKMFLRSVTYADDTRWRYEYSGVATYGLMWIDLLEDYQRAYGYTTLYLGKVELPTGGTIEYDYDEGDLTAGWCNVQARVSYCPWFKATDRPFPRLQTRTTSGPGVQQGVWSYDHIAGYQTSAEEVPIESVLVTGPTKKDHYLYYEGLDTWMFLASKGAMTSAPEFPPHPWPNASSGSAILASFMGMLYLHEELSLSEQRLRDTHHVHWRFADRGERIYNGLSAGDNAVVQPLMSEVVEDQTWVVDYDGVGIFYLYGTETPVSPQSEFDLYDFPEEVIQTGHNGADGTYNTRTTDYVYAHSGLTSGPWVIGSVDTQTLDGKTIDYNYTANMQLDVVNRYGVVTDYDYYPTGDLHLKKWTRDSQPHQVEYSSYFRGIPQLEVHTVEPGDPSKDITINRVVDVLGRIASEDNGRGFTTGYDYNGAGKLTLIDPPSQDDTNVKYIVDTTTGFLDELLVNRGDVASPGNYSKVTHLDGFGRKSLVLESDAGYPSEYPRSKYYTYDAVGRVATESAPFEYTGSGSESSAPGNSFSYDEFDRLTQTIGVNGTDTTTFCYRRACNTGDYATFDASLRNGMVRTNLQTGYQTGYSYSSFGHPDNRELTQIVQQISKAPDPVEFIVTTIERDNFGNITKVKQGDGTTDLERVYEYTPELFLWKVTNPETGITEFTYDEVGNRKTSKVGNSAITEYFYDGRNRLTDIIYPDPTPADPNDEKPAPDVTFEYNADDLVTMVGHDVIKWDYTYTDEGLVRTETLTFDGTLSYELINQYNQYGHNLGTVYPTVNTTAGNTIRYAPDAFGRPRRVKDIGTGVSHVSLVKYWPDNTVKSMDFANGKVFSSTRTNRLLPDTMVTVSGSTTEVGLDYNYDSQANPTSVTDLVDAGESRTLLGYDGADRLITANGPWGVGSIDYNNMGDITSKIIGSVGMDYDYDPITNMLTHTLDAGTTSHTHSFSYDDYGNVTGESIASMGYTYNDASQLIEVTGLPYILDFDYDGNGKRARVHRGSDVSLNMYSQTGRMMASITCSKDEHERFYYLEDTLVAREKAPCITGGGGGCHQQY